MQELKGKKDLFWSINFTTTSHYKYKTYTSNCHVENCDNCNVCILDQQNGTTDKI